jgi:uncharacterized LabA/DUF88 family protein
MDQKVVIVLDGGFVRKALRQKLKGSGVPSAGEVAKLCADLMAKPELVGTQLLRIYFYDSPPFQGVSTNPISGAVVDFAASAYGRASQALLETLELEPNFAVRRGTILMGGWKLGRRAIKALPKNKGQITAQDLEPDIHQKGVDLRIGLDIATIALKRIADIVVLVSGDSDLVPAMKFARKEGLRVYLDLLGFAGARREMKVHADLIL